jgi:hypothetical protein
MLDVLQKLIEILRWIDQTLFLFETNENLDTFLGPKTQEHSGSFAWVSGLNRVAPDLT